jgi:hypothetical protein
VTAVQRLVPLEGKSWAEANGLIQRLQAYHAAHYADVHRLQVLRDNFDDDWYWFAEYEGLTRCLVNWAERRKDEGWGALAQEVEEIFGPFEPTLIFPLNGVGIGDGQAIRMLKITRSPDSKVPLARRFARQVATTLSAKYDKLQVRTFSADFQDPGRIYWCFDYVGGNAGWESVRVELLADDGYIDLFVGASELFHDEETTNYVLTP